MSTKNIIQILKKEGILRKNLEDEVRDFLRLNQGNVIDFCVERGIKSKREIVHLLNDSYDVKSVDLTESKINPKCAKMLSAELCKEYKIIAFRNTTEGLHLAMANPLDKTLIQTLTKRIQINIIPYFASAQQISKALYQLYNRFDKISLPDIQQLIDQAEKITDSPEDMAHNAPIVSLVNHLLNFALQTGASDMHIDPRENSLTIRLRIDGVLENVLTIPHDLVEPLIARLKIISNLRIDEHMRPQDGRFTFCDVHSQNVSVRISIIPTLHGQKISLRFLDTHDETVSLDTLGVAAHHKKSFKSALGYTNGLILVTGPTGSGKTTTLHAMLKDFKSKKINISTIEDPIEYQLEGANQVQVNEMADVTFANGLRSLLRQDPDVIMVGEIRDVETARIAINAALTGHLVLTSLHTNNAAAAIPRLLDMGIEPFLLTSTLRTVVAQRLVRKVCNECTKLITRELPECIKTNKRQKSRLTVAKAVGCEACFNTGYKGRTGIYEILNVTDPLAPLIVQRCDARLIEKHMEAKKVKSLAHDAFEKVKNKVTTLEEVERVLR